MGSVKHARLLCMIESISIVASTKLLPFGHDVFFTSHNLTSFCKPGVWLIKSYYIRGTEIIPEL
jgi:hypothetical protein